jgi:hypothetical protein
MHAKLLSVTLSLLLVAQAALGILEATGSVGSGHCPRPQSNIISGRHGGLPLQFPFAAEALAPRPGAARYLGIIAMRYGSEEAARFNEQLEEYEKLIKQGARPTEFRSIWNEMKWIVNSAAIEDYYIQFPFTLFIEKIWFKAMPPHSRRVSARNVVQTNEELRRSLGNHNVSHARKFAETFTDSIFWDGSWRKKPSELKIAHRYLEARAIEVMDTLVAEFSDRWVEHKGNPPRELITVQLMNRFRQEFGESNIEALKVIARQLDIRSATSPRRRKAAQAAGPHVMHGLLGLPSGETTKNFRKLWTWYQGLSPDVRDSPGHNSPRNKMKHFLRTVVPEQAKGPFESFLETNVWDVLVAFQPKWIEIRRRIQAEMERSPTPTDWSTAWNRIRHTFKDIDEACASMVSEADGSGFSSPSANMLYLRLGMTLIDICNRRAQEYIDQTSVFWRGHIPGDTQILKDAHLDLHDRAVHWMDMMLKAFCRIWDADKALTTRTDYLNKKMIVWVNAGDAAREAYRTLQGKRNVRELLGPDPTRKGNGATALASAG